MLKKIELELKHSLGIKVYQEEENAFYASVRDWGTWELPEDCEDEEDYDWEELSESSYNKLQDIIERYRESYKDYEFHFQTSEKNYIDVRVILKEK